MIFPRNSHFDLTMRVNSLTGVWPFTFPDNPNLQKLYRFYFRFTLTFLMSFICTAYIELFILLTDDSIDVKEVFANLATTLLCTVAVLRVVAIKSASLTELIAQSIRTEDEIFAGDDKEVLEIYMSYVRQSKMTNAMFVVCLFIVLALYFVHPLFVETTFKFDTKTNTTRPIKPLPLSSWFPYDVQEYYIQSYCWHILVGTISASYVCFTDCFTFSMIIYPLGQINVLNHKLEKFDEYLKRKEKVMSCSYEEACVMTFKECVWKHQEVIHYITEFNEPMRCIMVLDFLQSSLQLASIAIIFLVNKMNILNSIYSGQFAFSMMVRLLVYYWYANDITFQSSNTPTAIYCSRWYEFPLRVKSMMVVMMMQGNRPLHLEIGKFRPMSLSAFIKIMRATYSYMMLVYRTKKN